MSFESDIELELEVVISLQATKRYIAGGGYSVDEVREQVHEEFASWLVNKFDDEVYPVTGD